MPDKEAEHRRLSGRWIFPVISVKLGHVVSIYARARAKTAEAYCSFPRRIFYI